MIPASRHEAVERALLQSFGVSAPDEITPMTAGLSTAHVFRIVVHGSPWLLRVGMPASSLTHLDPHREFACISAAAAAGIAPALPSKTAQHAMA